MLCYRKLRIKNSEFREQIVGIADTGFYSLFFILYSFFFILYSLRRAINDRPCKQGVESPPPTLLFPTISSEIVGGVEGFPVANLVSNGGSGGDGG